MMKTKLLCKHDWKKCISSMVGKQYRNRKWAGARSEEFCKLNDYKEFKNFGDPKEEAKYFAKYKKIQKHVIYDVNYVGRHRNRVIAGYMFGREKQGCLLIIQKSPYGLQFSRKLFNEPVFGNGKSQIWTQVASSKYKFVAIYLGKLLLTMGDPDYLIALFASPAHNLQYKGNNNADFH